MATTDIYRFVGFMVYATNIYEITLAFRNKVASDPSTADQATLAQDCKEVGRVQQTQQLAYTGWDLTQQWGPAMVVNRPKCTRSGGLAFSGTFTGTLTGADTTGEPLPPQCAMVVTLSTGFTGRRKRGRVYHPGFSELGQNGGTWTSPNLTNMVASWSTFLNKYKAGGTSTAFELGVWSERTASGCIPNPSGKGHINVDTPSPETAFTPVTAALVRPVVYSQRRRTLGVGR